MSYGRMSRFSNFNVVKIAAVIITFIVIIIVMIQSVVIVEAGHRGVVLYLGAVENRVLPEGIHFIIPFAEQVVPMEVWVPRKNFKQKRPLPLERFTGGSNGYRIKLQD